MYRFDFVATMVTAQIDVLCIEGVSRQEGLGLLTTAVHTLATHLISVNRTSSPHVETSSPSLYGRRLLL